MDFDGTLTERDVNEALLLRFLGPEWSQRIETASQTFRAEPSSPALIETLQAATAQLRESDGACVEYLAATVKPRPGLPELIETAERLGIERHVVSYGFDFFVQHYLSQAGVADKVAVHCGETAMTTSGRVLTYRGPDGTPVVRDFKMLWTRWCRSKADVLFYAGDGGSDVAPAQLGDVVFARDPLFRGMPASYEGIVRPFETLHDIARGLIEMFG